MQHLPMPSSYLPACCALLMVFPGIVGGPASGFADAAEPATLATSGFDFRDTSGEARDQRAEHAKRLKVLGTALQEGLSTSGRMNVVPLTCGGGKCTARTAGLEALSVQAREAGARYLLVGEVQKMSTLVGGVKFAVLDLASNKPTCDRFLSYRGDTDEAWRRAGAFAAQDIEKRCLPE